MTDRRRTPQVTSEADVDRNGGRAETRRWRVRCARNSARDARHREDHPAPRPLVRRIDAPRGSTGFRRGRAARCSGRPLVHGRGPRSVRPEHLSTMMRPADSGLCPAACGGAKSAATPSYAAPQARGARPQRLEKLYGRASPRLTAALATNIARTHWPKGAGRPPRSGTTPSASKAMGLLAIERRCESHSGRWRTADGRTGGRRRANFPQSAMGTCAFRIARWELERARRVVGDRPAPRPGVCALEPRPSARSTARSVTPSRGPACRNGRGTMPLSMTRPRALSDWSVWRGGTCDGGGLDVRTSMTAIYKAGFAKRVFVNLGIYPVEY
jgi:hypothetical protein